MARVDMSSMKEKIKMTHCAYESPQKLLLLDDGGVPIHQSVSLIRTDSTITLTL